MKKLFRISLLVILFLVLTGVGTYYTWFHNPYRDSLHLDPASIFTPIDVQNGLVISDVTLIDVESGKATAPAHVLIHGDTIADVWIGEEPVFPENIQVIDGDGKFIMPGLTDVHTHLAMYWHLISGDFSEEDSLVTRLALEQFVRYGVTTILVVGGGGANDAQVTELKRLERDNAIVAPWIFAVGSQITAPGSHPVTTIMRLPADASPERLRQAGVIALAERDDLSKILARKKQLGLDGVKIVIESGPPPFHPKPRLSFETAQAIIKQAEANGLPVYAHTEYLSEFAEAVRLGVHGVMHSVHNAYIEDDQLIRQMKTNRTWYVPTLSVFYGFDCLDHPERLEDSFLKAGVPQRLLKSLEHPLFRFGFGSTIAKYDVNAWQDTCRQNLLHLHNAGVPVALGTDASTPFNFPGYNAHVEMELMVRAGLSNADVLRIATVNGARFLGVEDQVGTIAQGKVANLLLLNRNPLSDIRNTRSISRVILKGRLIDPELVAPER